MGPGLTETFETPDYLAEAGIEYVADYPMDDQPFDIRTKHGTLTSIPHNGGAERHPDDAHPAP